MVKIICPLTLYSILIQAGMAGIGILICKNRIQVIQVQNLEFSEFVMEMTFIGAFLPLILSPLAQLPEAGKKATLMKDWCKLQVDYMS